MHTRVWGEREQGRERGREGDSLKRIKKNKTTRRKERSFVSKTVKRNTLHFDLYSSTAVLELYYMGKDIDDIEENSILQKGISWFGKYR